MPWPSSSTIIERPWSTTLPSPLRVASDLPAGTRTLTCSASASYELDMISAMTSDTLSYSLTPSLSIVFLDIVTVYGCMAALAPAIVLTVPAPRRAPAPAASFAPAPDRRGLVGRAGRSAARVRSRQLGVKAPGTLHRAKGAGCSWRGPAVQASDGLHLLPRVVDARPPPHSPCRRTAISACRGRGLSRTLQAGVDRSRRRRPA